MSVAEKPAPAGSGPTKHGTATTSLVPKTNAPGRKEPHRKINVLPGITITERGAGGPITSKSPGGVVQGVTVIIRPPKG